MNYFDNKAIVDKTYDGKAFGSNAVALPGSAYVDLDIAHSLGADTTKIATTVGAGWTDNGDNTYTGATASSNIDGLSSITSGTVQVVMTLSGVTAGDVNGYDSDGTYTFEEVLSGSLSLVGTGFTGTVSLN